jgi:hypothetical protein
VPVSGTIFALDLGARLGYCAGRPGATPISGVVVLKKSDEHRSVAFANLICFLTERWKAETPALVVKEAMLPLQAFKNLGNAEYTVRMTAGLHAVVEALCVRIGMPFEDVADSTIRKHFIGRARMGNREATKAAVVNRARLLGYIPKNSTADDRADACATWDFAVAHYCKAHAPRELFLHGERAAS